MAIRLDPYPVPGVTNPVDGGTVYDEDDASTMTITDIIRYDGDGRFGVAVTKAGVSSGAMIYYSAENARWQGKTYKGTHYRDKDGTEKRM